MKIAAVQNQISFAFILWECLTFLFLFCAFFFLPEFPTKSVLGLWYAVVYFSGREKL